MEVHAHTHAHGKKTWKSYFWEFLMLFLAVFCGFLAENQREHLVEHKREKEFMSSMQSDLRTDTFNLNAMHQTFVDVNQHIDSLIILLKKVEPLNNNAARIYQHQVFINSFFKWIYTDRTINQLKNSGNFRLIRNKHISDLIINYDGFVTNFVGNMQDMYILPQWRNVNESSTDIFKSSVFRSFLKDGGWSNHSIQLPDKPYFLSEDKIKIQKFINLLEQYVVAIEWFNINTVSAVQKALQLDSAIQKKYSLK